VVAEKQKRVFDLSCCLNLAVDLLLLKEGKWRVIISSRLHLVFFLHLIKKLQLRFAASRGLFPVYGRLN